MYLLFTEHPLLKSMKLHDSTEVKVTHEQMDDVQPLQLSDGSGTTGFNTI